MAAGRRLILARFVTTFCLLLLAVLQPSAPAAETRQTPNLTPILDPEKSGAELAARIRSAVPPEPADEFKGNMVIVTRDDKVTTVPIVSVVNPASSNNWAVSYWALMPDRRISEELVIDHTSGRSNSYRIYFVTNDVALTTRRPPPESPRLTLAGFSGDQLTRPFAGSDFWLCDLGLEFLHWPQQRVLKHEMRRSRSCWLLESVTPAPAPGGYARVLSWIDVEYEGILFAEAYDKASNKIKDFKLGAFRKVDGSYQLESMKMRNLRTGSESELKFDLKPDAERRENEKAGKRENEKTGKREDR